MHTLLHVHCTQLVAVHAVELHLYGRTHAQARIKSFHALRSRERQQHCERHGRKIVGCEIDHSASQLLACALSEGIRWLQSATYISLLFHSVCVSYHCSHVFAGQKARWFRSNGVEQVTSTTPVRMVWLPSKRTRTQTRARRCRKRSTSSSSAPLVNKKIIAAYGASHCSSPLSGQLLLHGKISADCHLAKQPAT